MQAIVGDETGLLKIVDTSSKQYLSYGEQNRTSGIKGLSKVTSNQFSVLRSNGQVELWEITEDSTLELQAMADTKIEDAVNCLSCLENESPLLVCYGASGTVTTVGINTENNSFQNVENGVITPSQIVSCKGPIQSASSCVGGVVFGGKENDLRLYDIQDWRPVWTAANVPYDTLRLRVPIWITAVSFLRPAEDNLTRSHIATGTGHKQVRLYDTAAGQRPVASMDIGEFRVSSIATFDNTADAFGDGFHLYVADVAGGLNLWDLRMRRKVRTMKGTAGSLRCLQTNESGKYLACVGLDRILHLYKTNSNKLISSIYLKTRLNRCLLFGDMQEADGNESEDSDLVGNDGNDEDVLEEYEDSDEDEAPSKTKSTKPKEPDSDASDDDDVDIDDEEDVDIRMDSGNDDDDVEDEDNAMDYRKGSSKKRKPPVKKSGKTSTRKKPQQRGR